MTQNQRKKKRLETQETVRKTVRDYAHRLWYRNYYNLTPNDPRYPKMTDTEILKEFYTVTEYDKLQQENRKLYEPYCTGCGYIGKPVASTNICPTCGAEMMLPLTDANQATDVDVIETLESEGITLSKSDKELIRQK